jgi:hypothetical protein
MTESTQNTSEAPEQAPPAEDIPAGDFPQPPAWHLPLAATAWGLWMIFLICMAWHRYSH